MKHGYRFAIEVIAVNDEPLIMDIDAMVGMPSVLLLAALTDKEQETVARDVIKYRKMSKNIERENG